MTMEKPYEAIYDRIHAATDQEVITAAKKHGAKFHEHETYSLFAKSSPWVVLGEPDYPRLWWGFFASEADAARMYCAELLVSPTTIKE